MDNKNPNPQLLSFYFGDSANTAQVAASQRLKKWSRAFDQWIDQRSRDSHMGTTRQARQAWRRLVQQLGKMPWQISREDIELHIEWMKEEGYAANTINCAVGLVGSFYRWCDEQKVDRACGEGFNPAKEAARIKTRRYEGASVWTEEEIGAFLNLLSKDESEVGKRENAFFLMRINTGVSLKKLLRLRWEQLEIDETGAQVSWRAESEQARLPDTVWKAVIEALRVSGRLGGMQPGKYIFAPLITPGREATGNKAEDWLEGQPLSVSSMLASLKIYGRKLGIAEEKLTWMALRRTAVIQRMEQGESIEGMKAFMDSKSQLRSTKCRLGLLAEISREGTAKLDPQSRQVEVPVRRAKPFRPGENTTHGLYSHKRDREAVIAVLKEDIHGMKEETDCLRKLMRGLLQREGDEARLIEAYSKATQRLGLLVTLEEQIQPVENNPDIERFLHFMDEFAARMGEPPASPQMLAAAYGITDGEMGATGKIGEEVATSRLLLRNVYQRALQDIDAAEYMRLVDLYGVGCVRLARLLKIERGDESDPMQRYIDRMVHEALVQLTRELHLDERG
jgi:integrase